jgi:apolipoprotein N-acyltransferase
VRAANTGVSAIIDGYGRILKQLPLGTAGVIDGALPKSLPPTLFARAGNLYLFAAVALALALAGLVRFTVNKPG